jgi:hypothetical protein
MEGIKRTVAEELKEPNKELILLDIGKDCRRIAFINFHLCAGSASAFSNHVAQKGVSQIEDVVDSAPVT